MSQIFNTGLQGFDDFGDKLFGLNEAGSRPRAIDQDKSYDPLKEQLFKYPLNIGDDNDRFHYVVFDVFENQGAVLNDIRETYKGSMVNGQEGTFLQYAAGTGLGSYIGTWAGKNLGGLSKFASGVGGGLLGGLASTGTINEIVNDFQGANFGSSGLGSQGYVTERLGLANKGIKSAKSIYMYIPEAVGTKYGFSYADQDFSTVANLQALANLVGVGEGNLSAEEQGEVARILGATNLKVFDSIGELVGGDLNLEKYMEAGRKQTRNPFVEHLFEQVERRTFSFSFEMTATSQAEMENIFNIIKTFKRFSHPSLSEGGRYLNYPAEFQIKYMFGDKENGYLFKMGRCACTSIDVDYSKAGSFTTFVADQRGAPPVSIGLNLEFTELELLTRDRIDQGF